MAAISPVQNPQFDSLGRSPEALPFWSRYSLPQRVVFPAANSKRDVAHGLGAIPSGYLVLWSDAPISATPGVNWTPEIAYLQSPVANARAIVIFVQLRELAVLGAGGELLGPPPVVVPPTSTPWRVIVNTDTGTVNNWAPGLAGNTVILWQGSANLTINSIAGGVDGQLITIKNVGSALLYLTYGQLFNRVSSGPTPLAPQGSATYVWTSYGGRWDLIAHEQGLWITPPFNAANFSAASPMIWTVASGSVFGNSYRVTGKALTWNVFVFSTSLTGSPSSELTITFPGGYTSIPGARVFGAVTMLQDSTGATGYTDNVYGTNLRIRKSSDANYVVNAGLNVGFTVTLPID